MTTLSTLFITDRELVGTVLVMATAMAILVLACRRIRRRAASELDGRTVDRLARLMETAPFGMALLDGDLRLCGMNRTFARNPRLARTPTPGRSIGEILGTEDHRLHDLLHATLRTGRPPEPIMLRAGDHGSLAMRVGALPLITPRRGPGGDAVVALLIDDLSEDWPEPRPVDGHRTDTESATHATAANSEQRIEDGSRFERRFEAVLDVMLDNVTLARSIRDQAGHIIDFEIIWANRRMKDGAGREGGELEGRRVLELYPGWPASGLFDAFIGVVETGRPFSASELRYVDTTAEGTRIEGWWSIYAVPFGDGYLTCFRDVTDQVAHRRQAAEAAEIARRERIVAEALQTAALPRSLPRDPSLSLAARYVPATTDSPVGGDWYDAFELDDDTVTLVIGDIAGHGSSVITAMVEVRNLLRGFVMSHPDPGEALTSLHRCLERLWEGANFATCLVIHLAPEAGIARVARAGHPPPLVQTGRRCHVLDVPGGPPLGAVRGSTFPTVTYRLEAVDRLITFTDGLVESRSTPVDVGIGRLARLIESGPTPGRGAEAMCAWILDHAAPVRLDDTALLVAEFHNGHTDGVTLRRPTGAAAVTPAGA